MIIFHVEHPDELRWYGGCTKRTKRQGEKGMARYDVLRCITLNHTSRTSDVKTPPDIDSVSPRLEEREQR